MAIPNWVTTYENKLVGLTTKGPGGKREYRGIRRIIRVGLPYFEWAAKTEDGSDVIDLSLANDPLVWPVDESNV